MFTGSSLPDPDPDPMFTGSSLPDPDPDPMSIGSSPPDPLPDSMQPDPILPDPMHDPLPGPISTGNSPSSDPDPGPMSTGSSPSSMPASHSDWENWESPKQYFKPSLPPFLLYTHGLLHRIGSLSQDIFPTFTYIPSI